MEEKTYKVLVQQSVLVAATSENAAAEAVRQHLPGRHVFGVGIDCGPFDVRGLAGVEILRVEPAVGKEAEKFKLATDELTRKIQAGLRRQP